MPPISSPQNPIVKLIRSLAEKKYRQETGLFVAEGEKVLQRARDMGWTPDTLISAGPTPSWGNARLLEVAPQVMAGLSAQKNPPSLLAVFRQTWRDRVEPDGLWLALEDMRDPGNLGAIIRTADAAGARGVILAGQSCDPWSRDCVRATMGSIFAVPLVRMTVSSLIGLCKSWPGDVAGSHLQGTEDYRRTYREPTLVVMGSEGRGLSAEVSAACPVLVRISMRGGIDSLNVAVATGLMLFETRRNSG
jgi:RNA methyltransferase, TrmH family